MRVIPERQQRRHVPVGHEPDIAARPAVAPVGATAVHVCLTPE